MSLEGRGALITGGGRGIGQAVAKALAAAGARVVVSSRTQAEIDQVAGALRASGHEAWALACDVADPEQIEALVAGARSHLGSIQILVNNAGVSSSAPLAKIALEEWDRLLRINATAPYLLAQAVMADMVQAGWGRVVNVASIAGKVGAPYIAAYCASKHALVGFTRALAAEVANQGVTVNAVCPGYVDTPMTDRSIANIVEKTGKSAEEALAHLLSTNPQGRLLEAREVAHLVAILCGPAAKGINGQAIVLDGGMVQT